MPYKFFYPSYGARIWARRSHPPNYWWFWHFQICQNPGGDLEIFDYFPGPVQTLKVSLNYRSILYSANFDYKIIKKFRLWKVVTEISISKFLTPPPVGAAPNAWGEYPKSPQRGHGRWWSMRKLWGILSSMKNIMRFFPWRPYLVPLNITPPHHFRGPTFRGTKYGRPGKIS